MIALGPFVLSAERFSTGLGILVFLVAVAVLTRRAGSEPERRATQAVVLGVIAARVGFVMANLPVFLEDPLSALYLWQGGYLSLVGLGVAALWLGLRLRRMPGQLGAVAIALVLGAASWNTVRLLAPEPGASQLPTQTLATLDGAAASFTQGQPTVLNLWASWCPPCRREMPMMTEVAAGESEIAMVFANQGESVSVIRRFLRSEDLPETGMWLDPASSLQSGFTVPGMPATLFFDAEGALYHIHMGEISRAALLARMEDIRPASTP